MATTAAGHTLTRSQHRVACAIQDYLRLHGGDSTTGMRSVSPAGDGRWVPLLEIFPRSAQGTADRRTARQLRALGVLRVFEVALKGDCVKAVPFGRVEHEEHDPVPTKFWSRIFAPAGAPNRPAYAVKVDSHRHPATGERTVLVEVARWCDLEHPAVCTFRSTAVVDLAAAAPPGEGWQPMFDAMLEEESGGVFADMLRAVVAFANGGPADWGPI